MDWKIMEVLQILYLAILTYNVFKIKTKYDSLTVENSKLKKSIINIEASLKKLTNKPPVSAYVDANKKNTKESSNNKAVSSNRKKPIDDLKDNLDHYRVKYNLHKTLCDDIRKGKVYDITEKELLELNDEYKLAAMDKADAAIKEIKKKENIKIPVGEYRSRYDENRKMFIDSQSLINYVADENNPQRLLYDKATNMVKTVKSFDIINNSLCIFFAGHSGYETFTPNKYGEHGIIRYI